MNVEMLAKEGNGAVQVDESPDKMPLVVTLIGPIKVWWTEWDSPRHKIYTQWRDAVRVALVKAGCAVYSPHRAIQGAWNEKLQAINDAAIRASDFVVDLTPPGVPADGTAEERKLVAKCGGHLLPSPPGDDAALDKLLEGIKHGSR